MSDQSRFCALTGKIVEIYSPSFLHRVHGIGLGFCGDADVDAFDYWKGKFKARLELVLNELRHYWSEETVQAAAPLIEDLDLEIKSVTYIKPNEDENID